MRPHVHPWSRQDKEAWIKDKYVERKFLRKPPSAPAREAPRHWRAQKCQRHHSSPRAPTARRKVRLEPVLPSVAALSSGTSRLYPRLAYVRRGGKQPPAGGLSHQTSGPRKIRVGAGQAGGRDSPQELGPCLALGLSFPHLPAAGAVERKFRRDSLFCPDELDSLFSYFDAGAAAAGPRSKCSEGPSPLLPTPLG